MLSKTRAPCVNLEVVCDSSTGRLRSFVQETLQKTLFSSMNNLSHPGANASIRLVSDRLAWSRIKTDSRLWANVGLPRQKAKFGRQHLDPFHQPINGLRTCMLRSCGHCHYVRVSHIYRPLLTRSLAGARLFSCGISPRTPQQRFLLQTWYLVLESQP